MARHEQHCLMSKREGDSGHSCRIRPRDGVCGLSGCGGVCGAEKREMVFLEVQQSLRLHAGPRGVFPHLFGPILVKIRSKTGRKRVERGSKWGPDPLWR